MIQIQLGYQLKTALNACTPPNLPANCSSLRQLQQQQQKLWKASIFSLLKGIIGTIKEQILRCCFTVHSYSRGILISGFRIRGSVTEEWTFVDYRSPQVEKRYSNIPTLTTQPQDYLIAT